MRLALGHVGVINCSIVTSCIRGGRVVMMALGRLFSQEDIRQMMLSLMTSCGRGGRVMMMLWGRLSCEVCKKWEGRSVGGGVLCHKQVRVSKVKED